MPECLKRFLEQLTNEQANEVWLYLDGGRDIVLTPVQRVGSVYANAVGMIDLILISHPVLLKSKIEAGFDAADDGIGFMIKYIIESRFTPICYYSGPGNKRHHFTPELQFARQFENKGAAEFVLKGLLLPISDFKVTAVDVRVPERRVGEFKWHKSNLFTCLLGIVICIPICTLLLRHILINPWPWKICFEFSAAVGLPILLVVGLLGLPQDLQWRKKYRDQVWKDLQE
jgi:hypothetical protein